MPAYRDNPWYAMVPLEQAIIKNKMVEIRQMSLALKGQLPPKPFDVPPDGIGRSLYPEPMEIDDWLKYIHSLNKQHHER